MTSKQKLIHLDNLRKLVEAGFQLPPGTNGTQSANVVIDFIKQLHEYIDVDDES